MQQCTCLQHCAVPPFQDGSLPEPLHPTPGRPGPFLQLPEREVLLDLMGNARPTRRDPLPRRMAAIDQINGVGSLQETGETHET